MPPARTIGAISRVRVAIVAGGAVLLSLAPAASRAQTPPPVEPPVRGEAPVTVVRSEQLVTRGNIDLQQIAQDPERAAETLRLLELPEAQSPPDSAQRAGFRGVRATLLAAMGRRAESEAIIDQVAAGRFEDLSVYDQSLRAAMVLQDARRMAAVIEAAARHVGSTRPELIQALPVDLVFAIIDRLDRQNDQEALFRFYQALVGVDWPGNGDPSLRDCHSDQSCRRAARAWRPRGRGCARGTNHRPGPSSCD